jgi:hypothetical protein
MWTVASYSRIALAIALVIGLVAALWAFRTRRARDDDRRPDI